MHELKFADSVKFGIMLAGKTNDKGRDSHSKLDHKAKGEVLDILIVRIIIYYISNPLPPFLTMMSYSACGYVLQRALVSTLIHEYLLLLYT